MKKLLIIISGLAVVGCSATTPVAPTQTAEPTRAASATAVEAVDSPEPTATEGIDNPQPAAAEGVDSPESVATERVEQPLNHTEILNRLLFTAGSRDVDLQLLQQIKESGDTQFVAALIDTIRYHRGLQENIGATLNALTGQDLPADWFAWVEWAGNNTQIESFDGYPAWKGNLFAQIDPNFQRFVHDGMKVASDSRVEEIVWGGVRVDGIPALDNPTMIDPEQADYLEPQERIFGVSINGDTRAYPARFLDWHEMFNDIVGGEPVSLAY